MNKKSIQNKYNNLINKLSEYIFSIYPELEIIKNLLFIEIDNNDIYDYYPRVSIYISHISNVPESLIVNHMDCINKLTRGDNFVSYKDIYKMDFSRRLQLFRSLFYRVKNKHYIQYTCSTRPRVYIEEHLTNTINYFTTFKLIAHSIQCVKRRYS